MCISSKKGREEAQKRSKLQERTYVSLDHNRRFVRRGIRLYHKLKKILMFKKAFLFFQRSKKFIQIFFSGMFSIEFIKEGFLKFYSSLRLLFNGFSMKEKCCDEMFIAASQRMYHGTLYPTLCSRDTFYRDILLFFKFFFLWLGLGLKLR